MSNEASKVVATALQYILVTVRQYRYVPVSDLKSVPNSGSHNLSPKQFKIKTKDDWLEIAKIH